MGFLSPVSCGWRGGAAEEGRERGGRWRGLSGEFDIIAACAWCDVEVVRWEVEVGRWGVM